MKITVDGQERDIVLRSEKNAELVFAELDGNFANLTDAISANIVAITEAVENLSIVTGDVVTAKEDIANLTTAIQANSDAITSINETLATLATIDSVTAVDAKVDALRQELVDAGVLTDDSSN